MFSFVSSDLDKTKVPNILTTCLNLVLSAWEYDPLDPNVCSTLLSINETLKSLPEATRDLIENVMRYIKIPVIVGKTDKLLSEIKNEPIVQEVPDNVAPFSLLWWRCLKVLSSAYNKWDWLEDLLKKTPWTRELQGIKARLLFQSAMLRKDISKARETLALFPQGTLNVAEKWRYLGDIAFMEGDRRRAIVCWLQHLSERPWNVNLILRLHDVMYGIDNLRRLPPGKISVCLYSYNKRDALCATLEKLVDSDLGGAKLYVLINGSTDGSLEMVKNWQERLGRDRLTVISLPVNVGAPAARNWLMHHQEVINSDVFFYFSYSFKLFCNLWRF
jgi:tetratricopeptide (TPR) repeat protein